MIINMRAGSSGGTDWVFQTKTVTPTASGVLVTYDKGYDGLASVVVNGDTDLTPSNIRKGVVIFGVTGTY